MGKGDQRMNNLARTLINEKIYVDTSAWFSLMYTQDKYNERISSIYNSLLETNNIFFTTNSVVGETYTLMRYRINDNSTLPFDFLKIVEDSLRIKKIVNDEEIEKSAIDILKKYKDHKFSYVDATSFAQMKKRNIKYALTLDEYFSIAGFIKI